MFKTKKMLHYLSASYKVSCINWPIVIALYNTAAKNIRLMWIKSQLQNLKKFLS